VSLTREPPTTTAIPGPTGPAARRRIWALLAVAVVAVFVGVSRVYLGVHWPSDVAGGWIMAVVSLARAIYLWVVKRFGINERGSALGAGWFRIAVTALGVVLAVGLLVYDAGLNPLVPRASQGQEPRAHAATDVTRSPDRPTSARERQATCA
jgi:PAP2 superfamily